METTTTASGTFDIHFAGEAPYDADDSTTLAHDTATKTWHGDLNGSSELHMLSAISGTPGSAGYVVIEKFHGSVHGHEGCFVLQHHGLMRRGEPELHIDIVPDTGCGELVGITGTCTIDVIDGVHHYTLDYRLADHAPQR